MQPSTIQQIQANLITAETFRPFGQVIQASSDGKSFDREDAQLQLENGIPRFYIMRLKHRGRKFHKITRHQQCTQCLGSLEGKEWLIVVAPPGSSENPAIADLTAFRIPGNCFIKLHIGTWHAGPYFDGDVVDFYNLELSDTNIVDHDTCDLRSTYAIEFEII
ncbi:MAG: ureidoglycolate lyase [Plectolyngbya sp. WJT66-NPBG17]|jgi:ureidoglycolate hydrolase|nr:ureidoglycolate lyase [Plectolyngbya sp. WJT66-NPBG17]